MFVNQLIVFKTTKNKKTNFPIGMNGIHTDSSSNPMAHPGLLQPLSMQNLLTMAGIGHQTTLGTVPTTAIPTASSLSASASSLCKYKKKNRRKQTR